MEVGAVKQAFNNELILLKKKLNQAKIQIIHKLTRKAKTLVEKKGPEKIKEKFKRKAEAAVKEVLIIKKINPKDLARFIITHKGELNTYLNKPNVDQDKACARLLLHKALQDKYKFIRDRFSSVPIEDLLMSREERKKIKKEAREKQKNKKKGKGDNKVVNSEGDWDVEDVEMPLVKSKIGDDLSHNDGISDNENAEDDVDNDESNDDDESDRSKDRNGVGSEESEDNNDDDDISDNDDNVEADDASEKSNDSESEEEKSNDVGKFVKATPEKIIHKPLILSPKPVEAKIQLKPKDVKKVEKKPRDKNRQDKNKNLNEKLLSRKFKKELNETPIQETKVADPFFITSTGENYMSMVEPRQPDEVKEEHKQGNRKLRRAVMFGHVPKINPRRDNSRQNNGFNRNNNSFNKNDNFKKFNNSDNSDKRSFTDKRNNFNRNRQEDAKPEKEEKLHPSWEAKKKQSGILPFQGKKIVFDES